MIAPSTAAVADRIASQPPRFELRVQPARDVIYVKLTGELDLATTPQLRDAVNDLVVAGFQHIVIDLRALLFIDCAGVRLLLAVNADARRRGWSLSLIRGPASVHRVFTLTATRDILPFTAPPATHRRRSQQATPPARHDRAPTPPPSSSDRWAPDAAPTISAPVP